MTQFSDQILQFLAILKAQIKTMNKCTINDSKQWVNNPTQILINTKEQHLNMNNSDDIGNMSKTSTDYLNSFATRKNAQVFKDDIQKQRPILIQ